MRASRRLEPPKDGQRLAIDDNQRLFESDFASYQTE
jgi:hypothetical protein